MSNTIKRFDYVTTKMSKKDRQEGMLPFDPQVEIILISGFTEKISGAPSVSPSLISANEIDGIIHLLKKDIDAVGKKAKVALLRAQKETKIITSLPRNA